MSYSNILTAAIVVFLFLSFNYAFEVSMTSTSAQEMS